MLYSETHGRRIGQAMAGAILLFTLWAIFNPKPARAYVWSVAGAALTLAVGAVAAEPKPAERAPEACPAPSAAETSLAEAIARAASEEPRPALACAETEERGHG